MGAMYQLGLQCSNLIYHFLTQIFFTHSNHEILFLQGKCLHSVYEQGLNTETIFDPSQGVQTSSSICADQWEFRILCDALINQFSTSIILVRILKIRLERTSEILRVFLNVVSVQMFNDDDIYVGLVFQYFLFALIQSFQCTMKATCIHD